MPAYGKAALEQAIANHRKIARTAIRLKHSVAADNELNEFMPKLEVRLAAMLQNGRVPELSVGEMLELVGEELSEQ